MSESSGTKTCIKCGTDCAGKPRTKDAQGRYTCKPCFETAQKAAKVAAPVADEAAADAAVMASLLESGPASLTEMCPSCGSGMATGSVLCTTCGYNKQTGKATGIKIDKGPSKAATLAMGAASAVGGAASGPMAYLMAAVGASIGGAVGAGIWAIIAYYGHLHLGWIAWGVGAMAGYGAATASRRYVGTLTGVIAATIAVISVVGGRYMTFSMLVDDEIRSDSRLKGIVKHQVTDEEITSIVARDVAAEFTRQGKNFQWPEGVEHEHAMGEEEFPPQVWKEAVSRYGALDSAKKDTLRADVQSRYNAAVSSAMTSAKSEGFFETLRPFDALWVLLALGSAYSIGSGMKTVGESAGG